MGKTNTRKTQDITTWQHTRESPLAT